MFRKGSVLIWATPPPEQGDPVPHHQDLTEQRGETTGAEGGTAANVNKEAATSNNLSPAKLDCETGHKRHGDKGVTSLECQILKSSLDPDCAAAGSGTHLAGRGHSIRKQKKPRKTILTLHEDIISEKFWKEHPDILVIR